MSARPRRIRRFLVWLLNPRPPIWAAAWVWFAYAVLAAIIAPPLPWTGSGVVPTTKLFTTMDNTWPPFEAATGNQGPGFVVTFTCQYAFRVGHEYVEADWSVEAVPGRNAEPAPERTLESDAHLRWLAARQSLNTMSHIHGGRPPPNYRASWILADLVGVDHPVHRRVVWGELIQASLYVLIAGLILGCPILGFLRGAQLTWHRTRAGRLRRGRCPDCEYELKELPICPECGCDIASAAKEVERALGSTHSSAGPGA